jgi:predicted MPP superfamily phosphohydrolase
MVKEQRALILGDLHMPYHCVKTVEAAIECAKQLRPDLIVQVGDLNDQYCFSRYPRSTDHDTPKQELLKAKKEAAEMWKRLQKASPKAVCYQLLGNHDIRLNKRIMEKLPELYDLLDFGSMFQFKDVNTLASDRDILNVTLNGENISFHHGFLSKLGDHVKFFQNSCIVGHSHRPGIVYEPIHGRLLYEFNVGYMGNPAAHVFKYGATVKQKWGRGFGVMDSKGPRFVSTER